MTETRVPCPQVVRAITVFEEKAGPRQKMWALPLPSLACEKSQGLLCFMGICHTVCTVSWIPGELCDYFYPP